MSRGCPITAPSRPSTTKGKTSSTSSPVRYGMRVASFSIGLTTAMVSFRQRCETPVARASAARRLIRGDRHGWRAAPRPCAGKPQRQPGVRFRSERWRSLRCRVSPAEVRYSPPRRVRGLRYSSRASRPPDRAPPGPSGAAGKRGSGTARSCGVRRYGSGS